MAVQTVATFDLGDLRTVPHFLKKATLQFDEKILAQRGPDGVPASLFSCVHYGGLPTVEPSSADGLIPHEEDFDTGGERSFEVTRQVRRLIAFPDQDFGFVFGGSNEGDAEDDAACLCELSGFRLTLDYAVDPFRAP
jgi:hypothetical protein